ncbi:MAG TPA: transketolase [Terriglobales bacterium]|nr:transketolase [Terriglobales bacterium]
MRETHKQRRPIEWGPVETTQSVSGDIEGAAVSTEIIEALKSKSSDIRRSILKMVYGADSGHIGGSFSATELVVGLYYNIMRHDPRNPGWSERDRFVLSKGHCTPVLYAVLADCGYFPTEDLERFRRPGSHLQGHPYHPKTPGVEVSTGTLGLGLSTAMGMALGSRLRNQSHYYYVLCGDGELQEGQIWEAALFGSKYRLDNVIALVDRNYLQTDGNTEDVMPLDPLPAKWRAFGWETFEIDGHDFGQILNVAERAKRSKGPPKVIICYTVKGKGVSFMEDRLEWHSGVPNATKYRQALDELDGD